MRLAVCALSAILLSGCSWLGGGGYDSGPYGYDQQSSAYGYGNYGGCGATQMMVVTTTGCGGSGFGQGYGQMGQGYGQMGQGYGSGFGQTTTLGMGASYGSAIGGAPGSVQTVQGSPVYVPEPYPAYYNATPAPVQYAAPQPYVPAYYGGGANPWGLELAIGTDFDFGGDFVPAKPGGPFAGTGSLSPTVAVGYDDAFGQALHYEAAATYDLNPHTTLLGQLGYSKAEGKSVLKGTVSDGLGKVEDIYGNFTDLKQLRVEAGLRKYMGPAHGHGMRSYVTGLAGMVKTDDVTLTQSSATLVDPTIYTETYLDGGWKPTAAGLVGAEWAVGHKSAIGVETGLRWTKNSDTNLASEDRWTIPVRLRGRVSF